MKSTCIEHDLSEANPVETRGIDSIVTVITTVEVRKGTMTVTEMVNAGNRRATDVAENTVETIDAQPSIVTAAAVERKDIIRDRRDAHRNTAKAEIQRAAPVVPQELFHEEVDNEEYTTQTMMLSMITTMITMMMIMMCMGIMGMKIMMMTTM